MDNDNLDFSFNMEGIDRQALLAEAAKRLDALGGFLGDTPSAEAETPEGKLARELMGDEVEFSGFPVVYKITDKDFLTRNLNVPFRFKQLTQAYNFYWVYFPIALFPSHNWGFNRLDVAIEFNAHEPVQHLRPKAYQIFPDKKFQNLLKISNNLEIYIDENFEFSATTKMQNLDLGYVQDKSGLTRDAKMAGALDNVVGPFVYRLKLAKIDHTPLGMEKVFWRLDGTELFQDDALSFIVILQVPIETKEVSIAAAMRAYRYFSFANAGFQQAVKELPRALREFFTEGMPVFTQASWDITPKL
jgi:hypothetical protein